MVAVTTLCDGVIALALLAILSMSCLVQSQYCGRPGRPVNGWYANDSDSYPAGSKVIYYCTNKNMLFGAKERVCRSNGTWTDNIPTCESPIEVKNVSQSSTLADHTGPEKAVDKNRITFSATSGFDHRNTYWLATLDGKDIVKAVGIILPPDDAAQIEVILGSDDGQTRTSCGRFSGPPDPSQHTKTLTCPKVNNTKFVEISSYLPGIFRLSEVEIFVKKKGIICLTPDAPYHGYFNIVTSGSTMYVKFFCNDGYWLKGTNASYCSPSGIWAPPSPSCQEVTCEVPPSMPDGSVLVQVTKQGVVAYKGWANYTCNPGFALQGSSARWCKGPDTWSSDPPKCIPVTSQCDQLPKVIHGVFQLVPGPQTSSEGIKMAELHCDEGYRPANETTAVIRCSSLDDLGWTAEFATCESVKCSKPVMSNGSYELLDGSLGYRSRIRITCNEGYVVIGDAIYACQADGNWERDISRACQESLEPEMGTWGHVGAVTPCSMERKHYLTAVLIGALTAIVILSLALIIFILRKRYLRAKRNSDSVFGHVGLGSRRRSSDVQSTTANQMSRSLLASCSSSQESPEQQRSSRKASLSSATTHENAHYYNKRSTSGIMRPNVVVFQKQPDIPIPGPRPLSLTNPETDPVYAQPFEPQPGIRPNDETCDDPPPYYTAGSSVCGSEQGFYALPYETSNAVHLRTISNSTCYSDGNGASGDIMAHIYAEPVEDSPESHQGTMKWTRMATLPSSRIAEESVAPVNSSALPGTRALSTPSSVEFQRMLAPSLPPRRNFDHRKTITNVSLMDNPTSRMSTSDGHPRDSSAMTMQFSNRHNNPIRPASEHLTNVNGQAIGMIYNDVYLRK